MQVECVSSEPKRQQNNRIETGENRREQNRTEASTCTYNERCASADRLFLFFFFILFFSLLLIRSSFNSFISFFLASEFSIWTNSYSYKLTEEALALVKLSTQYMYVYEFVYVYEAQFQFNFYIFTFIYEHEHTNASL